MREKKWVALPADALDNPSLSPSEIYLLAQILRCQSKFDRFTVNNLNQILNLSKNTIRKGLLLLTENGYMTNLPDKQGWVVDKINICASEDQNMNSDSSEFELKEVKNCASNCPEKEEESTKEEDKDIQQDYSIYINNNTIRDTENDKEKEIKEKEKTETDADSPERFTAEYREIIDYLNAKTGKHFSARSRANQSHMSARLREGFTVEDFKRVIDIKWFQWHGDAKMAKFLRPETLFGQKFDRYLNEDKVVTRTGLYGQTYTVTEDDMNPDSDVPF